MAGETFLNFFHTHTHSAAIFSHHRAHKLDLQLPLPAPIEHLNGSAMVTKKKQEMLVVH